ncbi:DNA cytosine methyltransferase [Streptomyces lycii]|uniref:Cytosine-specific methyltransferase n=1 Tax=Streptomyces lycii TaxID=2654337 RepID=A0ABQ7FC61_9ACTN|nr:DNA cytosine methyltransferase [Streptomyces lycii]KAF4405860.1 DNA cytosine methyltransferase [Streptomyces lycii]
MTRTESKFTSVEICAGAGGQAVGLHKAGFKHLALIEIDQHACSTLSANVGSHPDWQGCRVLQEDLNDFDPRELNLAPGQLDLLAGGVPCPPFSAAGKQLGRDDERDLFPAMLRMVEELQPKAVMIENVRGLLEPPEKFREYREEIQQQLHRAGYVICYWRVLEACDYGVPQLRPRAILVAMREQYAQHLTWQPPEHEELFTVAKALAPSMRKRFKASGDPRADVTYKKWLKEAKKGTVAPTLVGGSKKHGGADLGPTRAKNAWAALGIDGMGVANEPEEMTDPERDLFGPRGPKLTVSQAAIIQGFPSDWEFTGKKTAAYRQVGNAFPPPVAQAVGEQIIAALEAGAKAEAAHQSDALFELPSPAGPAPAESGNCSGDLEGAVVS